MHPGDPELLMLSLPVFCQSARTHRKSERKENHAMTVLNTLEGQQSRILQQLEGGLSTGAMGRRLVWLQP